MSAEHWLSRAHSFKITLLNNRTEKEAVEFVRMHDPRVVVPVSSSRKAILSTLDVPVRLSRAFDLVRLPDGVELSGDLTSSDLVGADLIEVKATKARLPSLPYGFFFGATANEFELGERLGERFKFCFVCLHPETPGLMYVTLAELGPMVKTKRIQYQINLIARAPEQ